MIKLRNLNKFLPIIILVLSIACENKDTKTLDLRSGMNYPEFEERNTGLGKVLNKHDTLRIIVGFSDCGEWGGHNESIFLNRNIDNKVTARLIIDSVSCENIKTVGGYSAIDDDKRVIIGDISKILSETEEKEINLFLHRVFELYLNTENLFEFNEGVGYIYQGAGSNIHIINSNSTLNLHYYNIDQMANTWYPRVRRLFFETEK